ncbi:MAG: hypothetical protein AABX73_04015 [Nanoarchaeota archaeon]
MPKKRGAIAEHSSEHPKRKESLEEALLKNLVELQKVHTELAEKFDKLAKEITSLLALFEVTAKNLASHAPVGEYEKDKEFLEKIDRLLDQNKTIAKGLTLMEERMRERVYGPASQKEMNEEPRSINQSNRPLPRF